MSLPESVGEQLHSVELHLVISEWHLLNHLALPEPRLLPRHLAARRVTETNTGGCVGRTCHSWLTHSGLSLLLTTTSGYSCNDMTSALKSVVIDIFVCVFH